MSTDMSEPPGGMRRRGRARSPRGWAGAALAGALLATTALLAPRGDAGVRAEERRGDDALPAHLPASLEDGGVAAAMGLPRDSAAVAEVLAQVRGASPLMCALATRAMQGGWWSDHRIGIDPAGGDPRLAAMLRLTLARTNDPATVAPLRAALADPDACVQRIAARMLGRVDHARAREALRGALGDPNAVTREMAALGLGVGEDEDSVEPLVAALRDDVPRVRAMVAWALGEIESAAAIPALTAALREDRDAGVRRMAAYALGRIE